MEKVFILTPLLSKNMPKIFWAVLTTRMRHTVWSSSGFHGPKNIINDLSRFSSEPLAKPNISKSIIICLTYLGLSTKKFVSSAKAEILICLPPGNLIPLILVDSLVVYVEQVQWDRRWKTISDQEWE